VFEGVFQLGIAHTGALMDVTHPDVSHPEPYDGEKRGVMPTKILGRVGMWNQILACQLLNSDSFPQDSSRFTCTWYFTKPNQKC